MGRQARLFLAGIVLAACGSEDPPLLGNDQVASTTTECEEPEHDTEASTRTVGVLVDGADVQVSGQLTTPQHAVITWALDRFDEAELQLPNMILVSFDPSRDECGGSTAMCHPRQPQPGIVICQQPGPSYEQLLTARIAALHELAHLWHWSQGDGAAWPDYREIVGGEVGDEAAWQDRMHERVAVAISWGLLDQRRRPVRTTLDCGTLNEQFVALTGRPPLEPIYEVCRL